MPSLLIHMGEKHIPRTTYTQLVCNRHTLLNSKAISSSAYGLLEQWCQNYWPQDKKKNSVFFFLIFLFSSFLHQFFISLGSVFFLLACLHRAVCMRLMMGWGYRHLSFVQRTFLKLYKSHVVYPYIKTAHRWTVYFMILHLITQLLLYLINWPEDSIQQHWIIY